MIGSASATAIMIERITPGLAGTREIQVEAVDLLRVVRNLLPIWSVSGKRRNKQLLMRKSRSAGNG
jgi:hypothetical protein